MSGGLAPSCDHFIPFKYLIVWTQKWGHCLRVCGPWFVMAVVVHNGQSRGSAMAVKVQARYALIDLMRILTAIPVLLWHYQHFFAVTDVGVPFVDKAIFPLYDYLWPFYTKGYVGVPIFWILSGFVFHISFRESQIRFGTFFKNRFARLYPLHFTTLMVVAALQYLCMISFGTWLIYGNNDVQHFLMHLFFIVPTGDNYAFNQPAWSISAELLIYLVFWCVRRPLFQFPFAGPAVAAVIFYAAFQLIGGNILLCGFFFFVGGLAAVSYRLLWQVAGWMLAIMLVGVGVWGFAFDGMNTSIALAPLAAGAVILLAYSEAYVSDRMRQIFGALGDVSYGVYLWHVPVQLALLLTLGTQAKSAATQPMFLLLYLALAFGCAYLGFRFIEKPAGGWIRGFGKAKIANHEIQVTA